MWTCDRKRVYRNSGEGSRKASGRSQMGIVGLSGLRTTSGAGQMTSRSPSAEFCSPLRQALWGDGATSEPSSTVGPRRAQLIGGKWVEKECCRLCYPFRQIPAEANSARCIDPSLANPVHRSAQVHSIICARLSESCRKLLGRVCKSCLMDNAPTWR